MADVAVLALGLDTSQMKSGGDQANRTLDDIQRKFQELERRSNALKANLQGSGTTIKAAGQHWQEFGNQARNATQALSGIGGPIGQAIGRVQALGQQLTEIVTTFGLVGGAAVAMGAALAAAGSAFVALSIKGATAADELLDISEATGLTIDQVQRLGAAMQRSGESVKTVETSFRQFQQAVVEGIRNPTGEAAQNLRRLGVVATEAGQDTGKAFIDTLSQLKELRSTTEGAAATNEVFGRGIGALVRSSSTLQDILGKTRAELQATGIIASDLALGAAADLSSQIDRLSQSFTTFTIALNGLGGGAINAAFASISGALEKISGLMNSISKSPFWTLVLSGVTSAPGLTTPGGGLRLGAFGLPSSGATGGVTAPTGGAGVGGGSGTAKAERDELTASEIEGLRRLKAAYEAYQVPLDRLDNTLEESRNRLIFLSDSIQELRPTTQEYATLLKQVNDEQAKLNALIGRQVELLPQITAADKTKLLGLAATGEIPPSADDLGPIRETTLARGPGQTFFNEEQRQRVRDEVGFIFEDFVFSIVSGRKTVGEAFGSFALGIVDTFAAQFARIMQENFFKPVLDQLSDWLIGALDGLFSGISGKGIGNFFGKIFGGLFAEGGTLSPHKFGIVGERGPELVFAGNHPLTIQPMNAMGGGGNSVSVTFHVNAPGGSLDRRSMDQMSEQVLRAVERGTRNRGV